MGVTEKQIRKIEDKVYKLSSDLTAELEKLSSIATDILGYDVVSDICNGSEIEFRTIDKCGYVDDYECIRIEDVINKLKAL